MNIVDLAKERNENAVRALHSLAFSTRSIYASHSVNKFTPLHRAQGKKNTRVQDSHGFKFFRDMLAAAPRETEMSGTREAGWELMRFPGTR